MSQRFIISTHTIQRTDTITRLRQLFSLRSIIASMPWTGDSNWACHCSLQGDVLPYSSVATHSERTDRGDTAKTVACVLVGLRLDYANSILYSVRRELQRMENTIARVVKLSRSNMGVMNIHKDLHWLPIWNRIDFKIATLVYKVRSSSQPVYISSLISDYAPIVCV